jgi:hypothetical protein
MEPTKAHCDHRLLGVDERLSDCCSLDEGVPALPNARRAAVGVWHRILHLDAEFSRHDLARSTTKRLNALELTSRLQV